MSCGTDLGYDELMDSEVLEGPPGAYTYREKWYASHCCAVGILLDKGDLVPRPPEVP